MQCGRCGKENISTYKTCDACRAYAAKMRIPHLWQKTQALKHIGYALIKIGRALKRARKLARACAPCALRGDHAVAVGMHPLAGPCCRACALRLS